MELGDRMKEYERQEAGRCFIPLLPICARLDGKTFNKFTKGLERPFDKRLSDLMRKVTKYLVEETNAVVGYTQSDEITLLWYSDSYESQIFHNGKIQKMNSILAALCTAYFNNQLQQYIPEKKDQLAFFDCRLWQLPNLVEATNVLVWRELDAARNSISMAARAYYSHKAVEGKSSEQKLQLLSEKDIDWHKYPAFFKRGTYMRKCKITRKFTVDEIDKLPEKHEARKNPDLVIERSEIQFLDVPPIVEVQNRIEVLFAGAEPI